MSTNSTYEIRQRGIKVFIEGNRLDFKLEDPNAEAAHATVFFDRMDEEVTLGGSELRILPPDRNEDGSLKNRNRLSIRWGTRIVNLGLRSKDTDPTYNGKPFYYRGLDTENDANRPQTPEDLFAAMGFSQ